MPRTLCVLGALRRMEDASGSQQQRRERLRLEAAGRFARGDAISQIARDMRVTEGPVRRWRWHRAWGEGGAEALRPKGHGAGVAGEAEPAADEAGQG